MSEYHHPHETAQSLGITPATLRRWADYHKAYLSPETQPSSGQPRRFTNRDIEILKYCKHLRDQGLTVASINEQLAGLTFPEVDVKNEIEPVQDDQQTAPVTTVTPSPQSAVEPLTAYAIEQILTRVDRLERSNKSAVIYVGVGFMLACGMFIVILLLASIYGGFR